MKRIVLNPYLGVFLSYVAIMLLLPELLALFTYRIGVNTTGIQYSNFGDFLEQEKVLRLYISLGVQLCLLGYILLLLFKTKLFVKRKLNIKPKDFLYGLYGLLLKVFLSVLVVGIMFLMGLDVDISSTPENQQQVEKFLKNSIVLTSVAAVICAPIIEEFMFRKVLIGHVFSERKKIGLVISSLLFGGAHMLAGFSLLGFIIYTTTGFILGWFYMKTGRIETSIIVHFVNNFSSVLFVILT